MTDALTDPSTDTTTGPGRPGEPGEPGAANGPRPLAGPTLTVHGDRVEQFRAMASDVTIRVVGATRSAAAAIARARQVFVAVERACTRFDPQSPLMQANAEPSRWHEVPAELYAAVEAALEAHRATAGLFDPRVLRTLEAYGYDRSLPFADGSVSTEGRQTALRATPSLAPWRPGLDPVRRAVRLGPDPIDLGGIGKGLAVRWAAQELAGAGRATLVEAGGDCMLSGPGPDGEGWRVGVEDPAGGPEPVAVLGVSDRACATSSVRLRSWHSGGRPVHHLIDPRTGAPGGDGLRAVTVVDIDPARAEVWSKALFLAGPDQIAERARIRGLAALWVGPGGAIDLTRAMAELVVWRADHAG